MAKKAKGAKKEAKGKKEQNWPYYEMGGVAIGVSPHPEAEDAYALFVVVGDTGYAVAAYADEADAREAAEVLEEAMNEAQKMHAHGDDCDHDHGIDLGGIELDLEDEPKAKKGKKKGKAAKAKPQPKAKKPAKKGKKKK